MYIPTSEDTQEYTEAPLLLLIPAGLVEWMLARAHILWDLHEKIMVTISKTGESTMPTGMEMSLNRCLKGAMVQMGTQGCNILKPTAILTKDPVTIGLLKQRLDTTLGT